MRSDASFWQASAANRYKSTNHYSGDPSSQPPSSQHSGSVYSVRSHAAQQMAAQQMERHYRDRLVSAAPVHMVNAYRTGVTTYGRALYCRCPMAIKTRRERRRLWRRRRQVQILASDDRIPGIRDHKQNISIRSLSDPIGLRSKSRRSEYGIRV